MLQEASRDEFCSFIISSPIIHSEINSALGSFGKPCCAFRPFGFSIIPDGSRGLQSDASLVTIALPQVLDADRESDEVIEIMSNLVSSIVGAIKEARKFLLYPVKLSEVATTDFYFFSFGQYILGHFKMQVQHKQIRGDRQRSQTQNFSCELIIL